MGRQEWAGQVVGEALRRDAGLALCPQLPLYLGSMDSAHCSVGNVIYRFFQGELFWR